MDIHCALAAQMPGGGSEDACYNRAGLAVTGHKRSGGTGDRKPPWTPSCSWSLASGGGHDRKSRPPRPERGFPQQGQDVQAGRGGTPAPTTPRAPALQGQALPETTCPTPPPILFPKDRAGLHPCPRLGPARGLGEESASGPRPAPSQGTSPGTHHAPQCRGHSPLPTLPLVGEAGTPPPGCPGQRAAGSRGTGPRWRH